MNVRDALIQRLQARFARMRAACERFNDASSERTMVGPLWNVRDLVGHMAHWDGAAAACIRELSAGRAPTPFDVERVNEEVSRWNRRLSFVMLLPQLREAEGKLIEAVRAVAVQRLMESPEREWIDRVAAHYDHHWEGLEEAIGRMVPDE